jgi:perosamine synthetase
MINYSTQTISEQCCEAVSQVMTSDCLTGGPTIKLFEQTIAKISKVKYAVAVCNGTLALDLAVASLKLNKKFVGVTTPLTFAASANCILYNGGKLGLVDINNAYPSMDPDALEDFCIKNGPPAVVIPVSYAGIPANLPAIQELSLKYNFKIIEDAAHSFDSEYNYKNNCFMSGSCSHSDLAVFSFHPVKNITTAEGGIITTNSEELYHRLLRLRDHGMNRLVSSADEPWAYFIEEHGVNGRLSELHTALGLSQLNFLSEFKAKRTKIVQKYNDSFNRPELITPTVHPLESDPFYHIYPLRLTGTNAKEKRRALFMYLLSKDIRAQVHYIPIHYHSYFQEQKPLYSELSNSEDYYDSVISLPLYPSLKDSEQDHVINSVLEFLSNN